MANFIYKLFCRYSFLKIICFICSRKRETRDRDDTEKQWTEIETETRMIVDNDTTKKNGEEKSLSTTTTSSADESVQKVNPVKWTVSVYFARNRKEIYVFDMYIVK